MHTPDESRRNGSGTGSTFVVTDWEVYLNKDCSLIISDARTVKTAQPRVFGAVCRDPASPWLVRIGKASLATLQPSGGANATSGDLVPWLYFRPRTRLLDLSTFFIVYHADVLWFWL